MCSTCYSALDLSQEHVFSWRHCHPQDQTCVLPACPLPSACCCAGEVGHSTPKLVPVASHARNHRHVCLPSSNWGNCQPAEVIMVYGRNSRLLLNLVEKTGSAHNIQVYYLTFPTQILFIVNASQAVYGQVYLFMHAVTTRWQHC